MATNGIIIIHTHTHTYLMHPDVTTSRLRLPVIEFGRDLATESVDCDDSCDSGCSSVRKKKKKKNEILFSCRYGGAKKKITQFAKIKTKVVLPFSASILLANYLSYVLIDVYTIAQPYIRLSIYLQISANDGNYSGGNIGERDPFNILSAFVIPSRYLIKQSINITFN